MKILLTGSNGFIGSRVLRFLRQKNYKVTTILKEKNSKFKSINLNLLNYLDINEKFDILIHCASYTPPKYKNKDIRKNFILNKNVLKIAKKTKIKKVIFLSSMAVYEKNKKFIDENSRITKNDLYGLTKYEAEKEFLEYNFNQVFIMRLPSVIGLGCHSTFLSRIGDYFTNKTRYLTVTNKNNYFNNCIFIEDLCKIIVNLIKYNKKVKIIKNIKSKYPIKIIKIIDLFKKNFQIKSSIQYTKSISKPFLIKTTPRLKRLFIERNTQNSIKSYIKELKSIK